MESNQHLARKEGGEEAGLTGKDTRHTSRNSQQITIDGRQLSALEFHFSAISSELGSW